MSNNLGTKVTIEVLGTEAEATCFYDRFYVDQENIFDMQKVLPIAPFILHVRDWRLICFHRTLFSHPHLDIDDLNAMTKWIADRKQRMLLIEKLDKDEKIKFASYAIEYQNALDTGVANLDDWKFKFWGFYALDFANKINIRTIILTMEQNGGIFLERMGSVITTAIPDVHLKLSAIRSNMSMGTYNYCNGKKISETNDN